MVRKAFKKNKKDARKHKDLFKKQSTAICG